MTRIVMSVGAWAIGTGEYGSLVLDGQAEGTAPTEQLRAEELRALRAKVAAMAHYELENFYQATHNAYWFAVRLPSPG